MRRAHLALKRGIDVASSAILLAALSPVLAAASLAVRVSSRGPILYAGRRYGRDSSTFACLKFRSMFLDQAAILERAGIPAHDPAGGTLLKLKRDPRVTPVGTFLRASSIDELPQLVNVLRGEMSLVGPRPLVPHMLDPFPELRDRRGVMRPGITGLWQIRHRDKNTSVMDMIDDDLEYIRRFSVWLDLKIVALTIPALLSRRGAH